MFFQLYQEQGSFVDLILDFTPPDVGTAYIVTSAYPDGGDGLPKLCQLAVTTMAVAWEGFNDTDTPIERYKTYSFS